MISFNILPGILIILIAVIIYLCIKLQKMQAKKDTESKEAVEIVKGETLDTGGETLGSTSSIKGSFSLKDTTDTVATYRKDNIFKYCRVQPLITSEHEKEMYSLLNEAVGDTYYIFPQVHFSEILGTDI